MHFLRNAADGCSCRRPGFTIVELLVALTLSASVLFGVLAVLNAETKRLSVEREISDARYTLRAGAAAIAWDLRQAAAGDTALDALTDTSFILRSPTAAGVVCAKNASGYTLTDVTGLFSAAAADSVQVLFAAATPSWEYFQVKALGAPGTVGPALCVTAGSATLGIRLEVPVVYVPITDTLGVTVDSTLVPKDTTGILIGVPVLAYRRTLYGITTYGGKRWLGRRVADSPSWELLTGPLRQDGLHFSYYAMDGTETATPQDVVAVRITLRSESAGRTLRHETMQDTLRMRINLRNCDPRVC